MPSLSLRDEPRKGRGRPSIQGCSSGHMASIRVMFPVTFKRNCSDKRDISVTFRQVGSFPKRRQISVTVEEISSTEIETALEDGRMDVGLGS